MSPRGLRILLICSLVLNIFIIGGAVGAALSWKRAEAQRPFAAAGAAVGRPARLRQAATNLSPEYRRALRQTVNRTTRNLRPLREEALAAREDVGKLLTAPTLDRQALEAAMARARAADAAIRTGLENAVAAFAAGLPASERALLGDALAGPPAPPRNMQAPFPGGRP